MLPSHNKQKIIRSTLKFGLLYKFHVPPSYFEGKNAFPSSGKIIFGQCWLCVGSDPYISTHTHPHTPPHEIWDQRSAGAQIITMVTEWLVMLRLLFTKRETCGDYVYALLFTHRHQTKSSEISFCTQLIVPYSWESLQHTCVHTYVRVRVIQNTEKRIPLFSNSVLYINLRL